MPYPLAVFAPVLGQASETFIRRHMRDLLPGRTAVVASKSHYGGEKYWTAAGPCLILDRHASAEAALRAARRFLKGHGAQAILCEYLHYSTEFLELARDLRIPLVAHAHGFDVSRLLRDPEWRDRYASLASARAVVAVSRRQESLLRDGPLAEAEIRVIPCGVRVPRAPLLRPRAKTVRLLAVGRMVAKKAPILLLDAVRRAAAIEPSLRLDYVGGGELLPAAMQFLRAFALEGRVTLHGARPHQAVLGLMRRADIFVQHSVADPLTGDEEGLPVAILESMAAALPVVATRHAGIPEAVEDARTGYLVEEGDTEAMARRLVDLARHAQLRRKMGHAGWDLCRGRFSWRAERAALLDLLGLRQDS